MNLTLFSYNQVKKLRKISIIWYIFTDEQGDFVL